MSSEYVFADTATNGAHNRNQVMEFYKYAPSEGDVDCFMTYHRFTKDLLDYTLDNLHRKTKKPSVTGYPGPAWAPYLPYDFDDKDDPARAVAEAAHFVRWWETEWRVPPEALRIYWSGMKGISIEVPAELFGGFEPSPNIAKELKALAIKMTPGAETLDTSIYEKMRLWRVPNTKHGGSGLYKVRITVQELLDGTN